MIRAIAIDTDGSALKQLEQYCGKVDFVDLQKTFTETADALAYLEDHTADLLFLDRDMLAGPGGPFLNGLPGDTQVVLMAATSADAIDGLNLNAVDYLVKPFRFDRFSQAITKASGILHRVTGQPQQGQHLFIRADYRLFRLGIRDIIFIEGLDDYLKIHLEHRKPVVARMRMKAILADLPQDEFIRVHRSYIIPIHRISGVTTKVISVQGNPIPVGASYMDDVARRLMPK